MRGHVAKQIRKIVKLLAKDAPSKQYVFQVHRDLNGHPYQSGAVMLHPRSQRGAYLKLKAQYRRVRGQL